MATALSHVKTAMGHLGVLASGGAPSSDEEANFLLLLNNMLTGWQARYIGGVTIATLTNQKTITSTTISTFASISTDNTYPTGWDNAIGYNLAIEIAGALGKAVPPHVERRAAETLNAISPNGAVAAAGA